MISLQPGENSFCTTDEDNLSEQSTTDSCLGSLTSDDSVPLETLVWFCIHLTFNKLNCDDKNKLTVVTDLFVVSKIISHPIYYWWRQN